MEEVVTLRSRASLLLVGLVSLGLLVYARHRVGYCGRACHIARQCGIRLPVQCEHACNNGRRTLDPLPDTCSVLEQVISEKGYLW